MKARYAGVISGCTERHIERQKVFIRGMVPFRVGREFAIAQEIGGTVLRQGMVEPFRELAHPLRLAFAGRSVAEELMEIVGETA